MNKHQIAKKYSRALISGIEISDIPKVLQEFNDFSLLIDKNRMLKPLFAGPIFSEGEKVKAFEALKPLLKFNPGTEKFLKLIIIHGHLAAIKEVITATLAAYNEKEKKAVALVISSVTMDEKNTDRLKSALNKMTGREITVENRIDGSLLGGFIVKVGSTVFDSSVKGQLRLLRTELMR